MAMHNRNLSGKGYLFNVEPVHTFEPGRTIAVAIAVAVFLCALFIPLSSFLKKLMFFFSFLLSAAFVFIDLINNIKRGRVFCPELLAMLSSVLCFSLSGFGDGACVMLFYNLSVIIESLALMCEQNAAWSPVGTIPDRARISTDEGIYNIKASKVKAGDMCVVDTGCIIPADGIVLEGMSELELCCFDFKPELRTVVKGSRVLSGFVNNGETIVVEAEKDYADSFIQTIYSDFSKSVNSETAEERRLSLFFNYFTVGVCIAVILLCAVIPIFKGGWAKKAFIASTLLLVCSPFCIKGSITVSTFKAVEKLFSSGAIIRNAGMVNSLATVSELVCNKTGTVTESAYTVTDIQTQGISDRNFLILASKIECSSDHPIAAAIRSYCGTDKITPPEDFSATEIEGRGIVAEIGGNRFMFGNAALLYDNGINCLIPDKKGVAVHLAVNGKYCGYILLENRTRQSAYDSVESIRALGVGKLTMLSCDLRSIARPVAASLNFDSIKSELTLEEKLKSIRYIMENKNPHTSVAYVGNGIGELAAGSEADINIGTGMLYAGSELNETDVSILSCGLDALPGVIKTAWSSHEVSKINLYLSVGIRLVLLPLALPGYIGPVPTAVVLLLVSAFACFNSIFMFGKY